MGGAKSDFTRMLTSRPPRRLPASGSRTVGAWWRATVEAHTSRDAVREHGYGVTYRELDDRSARLACGLLSLGLGKGARVGLLFPNGSDWIASWLAVSRIGGIAVCLSTFFSPRELADALQRADVAVLLAADRYLRHDYLERLEGSLPELRGADGQDPLVLLGAPYLRSIWTSGVMRPSWSRGSLLDLEAMGERSRFRAEALLPSVERASAAADLAIMIFTSGSTATPKAVAHTNGVLTDKILYMAETNSIIPFDTEPGDRLLIVSPLFWVGGLLRMGGALSAGATVVCEDDHSVAALAERIRSERVTHVSRWGPVEQALEEAGCNSDELDSFKPQTVTQLPYMRAGRGIPSGRFPNSLGMTETMGPHSGQVSGGLLPEGKDGSFGPALPGMEFKIVDPLTREAAPSGAMGELLVRGRWLMDGFYKCDRNEVFEIDGFYATGDNCSLDDDGHLYFHGRLGGMIKTSGANVSPEEVETVIRSHPDILEVAVFGIPHPTMDEMVAAVVAKRPLTDLDEPELQQFLRSQLSSFKVPKRIVFMAQEDLPRTASQKIRKAALVELVVARSSGHVDRAQP